MISSVTNEERILYAERTIVSVLRKRIRLYADSFAKEADQLLKQLGIGECSGEWFDQWMGEEVDTHPAPLRSVFGKLQLEHEPPSLWYDPQPKIDCGRIGSGWRPRGASFSDKLPSGPRCG